MTIKMRKSNGFTLIDWTGSPGPQVRRSVLQTERTMQARMRRIVYFVGVAVALFVIFGGKAFAESDPLLGTWELNLAKSKYEPGQPPKSETMVNDAWDTDGLTYTIATVQADGKRLTTRSSAHYDSKNYNVMFVTGRSDVETVAFTRVDASTTTYTLKKGGKVVQMGTAVVSTNGRVLTITATTMSANGRKVHDVTVFDKQ
jgi:hypothetical protein